MKKVILPALLVGGLTLFSFTKSTNGGVTATGKNLEQNATGLQFAQQDQKQIKDLAGNYDLSKTQLVESHTKDGIKDDMKRSWIFKSKFSLSIFDANVIVWGDNTSTVPQTATKALEVLGKYTKTGSANKVSASLYNLSSKSKLSADDQKVLIDLVKKEYNLSDEQLREGVTLEDKSY